MGYFSDGPDGNDPNRPTDGTSEARPTVAVHLLSNLERQLLREANQLLTVITETHSACCECSWCEARILTDVQDEESFSEEYLPHE